MTLVERPPLVVPGRIRSVPPVLGALLLAGVLHLLWWQFLATSGGDIAAQDAWAEFARTHPGSAYNLGWYGGMHPVSYSVVSPYIMAAIGVRTSMIVAGTLSAGLLAWLVVGRREGRGRWLVALYGAVALAGNALSGRVTFALGTLFALLALCVVFAWPWEPAGRSARLRDDRRSVGGVRLGRSGLPRLSSAALPPHAPDAARARPSRPAASWHSGARLERWVRGGITVLASALATASSPVAGAFLGLVAVAIWVRRRRPAAYALGIPPIVVVAVSAALFPFSGRQPMAWYSTILPVAMGLAVVILTPRHWRLAQAGGVLYILSVIGAWLIPSPVGTNVSRLGLLFGGVILVAAVALGPWRTSLIGRRYGSRAAAVMLGMALITSTIWQTAYAVRDVVSSAPPESFTSDIDPLIYQLEVRDAALGRVEVVPTKSHREAAALAPHVPLARGWNRQADAERNPVFYRDRDLTADAYHRWLRRWAVRFVVLSTAAAPDPAAADEAELVAGGLPYLDRVWSDDQWALYAVRHPTPLVSPPAKVVAYDAAELTITTPVAGRIVIRIADSPWLSLVDADGHPLPEARATEGAEVLGNGGPACLTHLEAEQSDDATRGPRDDWLVLRAPAPGTYRIAAPYKLPRGTSCPSLP